MIEFDKNLLLVACGTGAAIALGFVLGNKAGRNYELDTHISIERQGGKSRKRCDLEAEIQNSLENSDQNVIEMEVLVQDLLEIVDERNNQVRNRLRLDPLLNNLQLQDLHADHVNFDIMEINELDSDSDPDEGDSGLESDDGSMV